MKMMNRLMTMRVMKRKVVQRKRDDDAKAKWRALIAMRSEDLSKALGSSLNHWTGSKQLPDIAIILQCVSLFYSLFSATG